MRAIKISAKVFWVGAIDWELSDFHGYKTSNGSTYNAYLIMGKKPVLIDTVKEPFFDEMMMRISSVIDPTKIAYIISNHSEMDHSGSLIKAIEAIAPQKVFASKMGKEALDAHFHATYPITPLDEKDELVTDDIDLKFIATKMLHWPDSMFTYFVGDKILFTQDAFGMHLATSRLFANENDPYLLDYEAKKYFANILSPYSDRVLNLLSELPKLNWAIDIIAPDHGPIWNRHEDIEMIINKWTKWAQFKKERKVIITYDTMWESTKKIAHALVDYFMLDDILVKVMPMRNSHRSDIATELIDARGFLVGSPTINSEIFPTIADLLTYLKGLKIKGLIGQAFGSFGWNGKGISIVEEKLRKMSVELVGEPFKIKYVPRAEDLKNCLKLAQKIGELVKNIEPL